MHISLYISSCFPLAVFKILSSLNLDILIITCLGVDFCEFILFGVLSGHGFDFCFLSQVREVYSYYFFK